MSRPVARLPSSAWDFRSTRSRHSRPRSRSRAESMPDLLDLPFDDEPVGPARDAPWSVSELTAAIRGTLELTFGSLAVEGEISNCRQWSSGHLYFTLKDEHAQVRAVMFRSSVRMLRFRPEDGMRVIARGRLSVYDAKGEYQIICDALEPHGLGARQAAFEA